MAANKGFQRRDTEKHMPPHVVFQPRRVKTPRPGHAVPEREFWKELERRHELHEKPAGEA
jgi:hypothetical protein